MAFAGGAGRFGRFKLVCFLGFYFFSSGPRILRSNVPAKKETPLARFKCRLPAFQAGFQALPSGVAWARIDAGPVCFVSIGNWDEKADLEKAGG